MTDVTAVPAQQDEAKDGRRMQYYISRRESLRFFLRFLFDRLRNFP